jgi:hypothetical protein
MVELKPIIISDIFELFVDLCLIRTSTVERSYGMYGGIPALLVKKI